MKRLQWRFGGVVALVAGLVIPSQSLAFTIDFETLTESDSVTTQFSGLTFTNATVLTAGSTLNEFEFPPSSGTNVVFDNGGAIQIDFATTALTLSGLFTYSEALTITAFDALLNPVATVNSLFTSNLGLSGDVGSSPNEILSLTYAGGISRVLIAGNTLGASFTLDDLSYTTGSTPPPPPPPTTVPEPASAILLVISVLIFAAAGTQIQKHLVSLGNSVA